MDASAIGSEYKIRNKRFPCLALLPRLRMSASHLFLSVIIFSKVVLLFCAVSEIPARKNFIQCSILFEVLTTVKES